jgi:hypothetical protein
MCRYLRRGSAFTLWSTSSEKYRCITAQILDSCRVPITIRSEDKVYNGLFLMWREQLLLDRLVLSCLSSVIAMPLGGRGKREWGRFVLALCSGFTGVS